MTAYLVVGLVGLVITFVSTPAVRWFALKIGAVDHPSDRKVHALATPTLGGLAIFLGILGAGAAASLLPTFKIQFTQSSEPLGIAAGAIIVFILGAVDDLRDLPVPVKLAGEVFAAGILFLAGVKMQYLMLPIHNGAFALSDDVSVLVTVFWIVAMINAVNLVDGLDGLAAGIVAIASAAFFVYTALLFRQGVLNEASSAPLISIILVGVTLGFLRYNFYPAKVFMGDSGAMALGLVLGAATITGIGKLAPGPQPSAVFLAYFPLLIPLLVIAIPLLDGVFAVIRRARRGQSVFVADKEHIHHRLMDLGHGHRQAVIVMYVWSALAAGAALAFTFLHRSEILFGLPIAVGAIVLYTLFPVLTKAVQNRTTP